MSPEAVAGRVVVDRYELIETLGTGPMGPVWRAHDRRLQREVAVREVELPDILDDAEQAALAEKVLREASSASQVDHPGVVSVLDVVTEGGQPFVVSELVEGRTLVEVVDSEGALPPEQVAAIGLRLVDALAAAHDLGLVHRDVRPSNVLLTETGVRLADFGVASMVDDPRVTMHEPSYLAPEQMESAGATALSDLWSLGATMYFAVEGEPPFDQGSPATTIAAIVSQAPRPTLRAGVLQPALDALLVKEAMDRPDDVATRALLAAAAGALGTAPAAPPPPAAYPPNVVEQSVAADEPVAPEVPIADAGPEHSPEWAGDWAPPPPAMDDPVQSDAAPAPASASRVVDDDETWLVLPPLPPGDPLLAFGTDARPAHDPPTSHDTSATHDALTDHDTSAAHDTAPGTVATRREPWFFQFPVETVPPPPLPEPPVPVAVGPERPPGRLPRGVWAALLAALVAGVMVALIITGGHTLRAQRPTIETSRSPGALSTWVPYTDAATGFTIRYPPSWSVRRTGTQTFFVDPAGVSYLEVDHQQPPAASLTASAFDQEKTFSASHPTYKRIGIDANTYQDRPASLWQFTYAEGGTNIRAIDLGVNGPKYGFALFFQARADNWTRAQGTFENFKSVFGIPN